MIKVAFIDSGIDESLFGHGTSMMSVFSNSTSIECEILSYRAGGDAAIASDKILARHLIDSIRIAVSHGANIINVSMGISSFRDLPALQAACDEAYRNNCLVVAAAGNESSLTMPYRRRIRRGQKSTATAKLREMLQGKGRSASGYQEADIDNPNGVAEYMGAHSRRADQPGTVYPAKRANSLLGEPQAHRQACA
jgi:hypothetical protein